MNNTYILIGVGLVVLGIIFISLNVFGKNGNTQDIKGCTDCNQTIVSVNATDFKKKIEENNGKIIDIRTPQEYVEGHIKNSTNLDYYSTTFRDDLNKLDKNQTYYIYCRSGSRSNNALSIMKELGFTNVVNLQNGILEWSNNGYELVK